jgi:hypothetical protein
MKIAVENNEISLEQAVILGKLELIYPRIF